MSIKSIPQKFTAYKVPVIVLKNNSKTWMVGNEWRRTPNTVIDNWYLDGAEIQSNPTEILGPTGVTGKKSEGVGFICHEVGVTISLKRTGPAFSKENSALNEDLVLTYLEKLEHKFRAEKVPFILISNNGDVVEWGGYIRRMGLILTDGPGKPAYKIQSPQIEILNQKTGRTEMGYLCDETGVTVEIGEEFSIDLPEALQEEIKARKKEGMDLSKVQIKINFSGIIGKLATFDKIQEIFDVGQSKRNLYTGIILGAILMFIIRLVV